MLGAVVFTTRIVTMLSLMSSVAGCGIFDFEQEQPLDEAVIEGNVARHDLGRRVNKHTIPPQLWEQELPQEPAGIFVEDVQFDITDTAGGTFEFMDSLLLYVEPTTEGTALKRRLLAWSFAPGDVRSVAFEVNRALNLVPYILEGFQIASELDAVVPPADVSFKGTARLSIDLL